VANLPSIEGLARRFEPLACRPGQSDEERSRNAHFTLAMSLIIPAGLLWALIYALFGAYAAAAMPLAYSVLSTLNLLVLSRTGRFRAYQLVQLLLILLVPFATQLALGGFVGGSGVVLWALLAPFFALLFTTRPEAAAWFTAFVAQVVIAAVAQPSLRADNDLPDWLVSAFFAMNISAVSAVAFTILASFINQREQLRALEVAYLEQTVMLRQREKLATLGTLAAGVAHELNNPAAAVRRAASQLEPALAGLRGAFVALATTHVTEDQMRYLADLFSDAPRIVAPLAPLEQSAHEQELEDWLDEHGVPEPWDLAPLLAGEGHTPPDLERLVPVFDPEQVRAVCSIMAHAAAGRSLTANIGDGATRISDIVGALRSYSYLDRGTVQQVDITEGIESTLVLLRGKLRDVQVEREYGADLPPVQVRGSELNQVWTNIIHNAVDAMDGRGTIRVRARRGDGAHDGGVVVEIEDDGPGIPEHVVPRVFDPFFTTKEPGAGTGLGLNISHNIVVRQHGGEMSVDSRPGRTRFRVALPMAVPESTEAADDPADDDLENPYEH
jgi:signal transduction histidine kinase